MGIIVYSLLWVMQDLYHQPQGTGVEVHFGCRCGFQGPGWFIGGGTMIV